MSITLLVAGACGNSSTGPDNGYSPTNPDNSSLTTIFITGSVYSPNPAVVPPGMMVNWKNNDSIAHSATLTTGNFTFETGDIPPLSAHDVPVAMTVAGTFTFHCRLHGESGTVIVR